MKKKDLPPGYLPTVKDAEWFLNYWEHDPVYSTHERALHKLFLDFCPRNYSFEDILIKCSALNDFYSTNIFDVHTIAQHIYDLKIDDRLAAGDYSLINDIAHVQINGTERTFYSFATKYCSNHQPNVFAIYDNYVEKVLLSMNRKERFADFKREDLKDYAMYMSVINSFRRFFGLTRYSVKELDQYLWQLGKWYFNQYGVAYKYYNREDASPFSNEDIRSKFWHGEMMFVTNHLSVGEWKESGRRWLKTANDQVLQLAQKYSPEQFGVICYITALLGKGCPYDDLTWILEY